MFDGHIPVVFTGETKNTAHACKFYWNQASKHVHYKKKRRKKTAFTKGSRHFAMRRWICSKFTTELFHFRGQKGGLLLVKFTKFPAV